MSHPLLLLQDAEGFQAFQQPHDVLCARSADDVLRVLERADEAIRCGWWVAGFVAYEAAAAFGLPVRPPDPAGLPLVWLGVFDAPAACSLRSPRLGGTAETAEWSPESDAVRYRAILAEIQRRIASGHTYQANYTFRLRAPLVENPREAFVRLFAVQRPAHAALVDLGRFVIASASPELFFERRAGEIRTRPMKGTLARGLDRAEDESQAAALRRSEKERAENLMIVDMLRNDLGRVAELGSVSVPSLFDVERYPTVLQMTSTVRARSREPLSRLFEALFPCASVTGAPKRSTMELLARLETGPRGVYTGAIGWAAPDGDTRWSVAIRTVVADRERRLAVFGTGSGVVADSRPDAEYEECRLKARVLDETAFGLIETLAWLPGEEGFRSLEAHLRRLRASAERFSFPFAEDGIRRALAQAVAGAVAPLRVRLCLRPSGHPAVSLSGLPPPPERPLRVGLAVRPIDSRDLFLRHKTTRRAVYEQARASRPDCDDVLLWNERGEITEASASNVVLERAGQAVTPPASSGLLPGIGRELALAAGRLREGVMDRGELGASTRLWLVSSLRGWREAVFVR